MWRQKGWNEPLQEAESELILDINHYDYFVAKDHIAIYLRRPTRERVTTILTGFRSARIKDHSRYRFSTRRNICDGQSCQSHATNTKDVESMLNPLKRERGRNSKKFIRISIFDSYENETNCILPMMDPLFFSQRDTRPVGEMR